MNHNIKTSLDKINPDEAAEHRMLNEALRRARAADTNNEGGNLMLTRKKYVRTALLAAALICVLAVSVFAAVKLLTPVEIAEWLDPEIAKAFKGADAQVINETKTSEGYEITLLGIAPAQNFSVFSMSADGQQITSDTDRVFAAIAVRRADGTALLDYQYREGGTPFLRGWPYIQGVDPSKYFFEAGGGIGSVEDGVLYFLFDCLELFPFADRSVFLSVSEVKDEFVDPYNYDEATGKFVPNPAHQGFRVLFELPLDQSKANPLRAAELLQQAARNAF